MKSFYGQHHTSIQHVKNRGDSKQQSTDINFKYKVPKMYI